MGCFCCTSYTFSSLKFQTSVSCPIFTLFVSNIKRTVTCIRSKETKHFHHLRDFFFLYNPLTFHDRKRSDVSVLSSLENQKPCEHHYHEKLRWQILDQRCNSRASRNVGSKMLVVFLFFYRRNFRPGNQTHPAAKTVLAARSLEFNVSSKILTNSGEKQEIEMLEWNTCSGWLHYHIWSIATALKELQGFFKIQLSGDPIGLPEGRPGRNVCHSFSAEEPLSAFLDALQSTPMSL